MKIAGSYTIRIADKPTTGIDSGTIVTVEVTTRSGDDATTVADILGSTLEKLGLEVPQVQS